MLMSFAKDMKNELQSINKNAELKNSEAHIFNQLSEFIATHSRVKQLSELNIRTK